MTKLRLVSAPLWRSPGQFAVGGPFPGAVDLLGRAKSATELAGQADTGDDTPALITFTSGSTGQP